jgi:hypothetical protein
VRTAFKEWAVVVDALGRGDQILILRKGGIHEGKGGFQIETPRFFLLPTLFHQQRDSVIAAAQNRFDEISPSLPPKEVARLEYFCEVTEWRRLNSLAAAAALHGQHVWRDEVIAERFEWGRESAIHALAVRVFQLPEPVTLPMLLEYGGCKSWITLDREIPTNGARPVLPDSSFETKVKAFLEAIDLVTRNSNAMS